MITVDWKNPLLVPEVAPGTEELFWVAAQGKDGNIFTYLAQYQNRPLVAEDHELYDEALHNTDGEAIESIGWVEDKAHAEFDHYYDPIVFDAEYQLLGWANYRSPEFSKENGPVELTIDEMNILGRPNFQCAQLAKALIKGGVYIDGPKKAEYEQAVFIHWAHGLYQKHGPSWQEEAEKFFVKMANDESAK